MRLGGTLLTTPGDATGTVVIENDRIVAVEPNQVDSNRIISPAFIDAHLHLPQFDAIGASVDHDPEGRALLRWLNDVVFPHERRWEDPEYAADMTARVGAQLLSCGTVGVCAYATVHHEAAAKAMRVLADLGHRGLVGQVLMDREAPPDLVRPAAQLLDEASRLSPLGRISPCITPRFAISCTPELLAGAARLAAEMDAPIQTHLAETRAETKRVAELFDARGYVDVYKDAGILADGAILAHAVWLDDDDRRDIAASNAIVAHCPAANEFLGSGAMDLRAARSEGIPITLGSDIAGGPDIAMPRVARAMIETAQRLGHERIAARDAWLAITTHNADALGWPDAGRIEPGAAADLLVIEPDIDWRAAPDPYGALLYAWDDRWIKQTICRGTIAYQR